MLLFMFDLSNPYVAGIYVTYLRWKTLIFKKEFSKLSWIFFWRDLNGCGRIDVLDWYRDNKGK